MPFSDYSLTPASNTTLAGLNLSENNTAVASLNNMLRQLMADGKDLANTVAAIATPMPLSGGAFTGDITRSTRGAYLHWNSASQTSGRVYIQATGGADPTSANGDILLEYAP